MSEKKLVSKLAKVMQEVKYIEKRGYNKFHKYNYATESDVSEKVREILAEQNVMMLPDVVEHTTREHTNLRGNTEYIATVKMKFTFVDGETGEELSIHSIGEGQDAGDKAVYKAITGATKYALMKAFMIPTGDDPEADNGVDERNQQNNQGQGNKNRNNKKQPSNPKPITQAQVGLLKVKAKEYAKARNRTEQEVYSVLKITDIEKLTQPQAQNHINQLDTWIRGAKPSERQKLINDATSSAVRKSEGTSR